MLFHRSKQQGNIGLVLLGLIALSCGLGFVAFCFALLLGDETAWDIYNGIQEINSFLQSL